MHKLATVSGIRHYIKDRDYRHQSMSNGNLPLQPGYACLKVDVQRVPKSSHL